MGGGSPPPYFAGCAFAGKDRDGRKARTGKGRKMKTKVKEVKWKVQEGKKRLTDIIKYCFLDWGNLVQKEHDESQENSRAQNSKI